jgi:hypothetical protein
VSSTKNLLLVVGFLICNLSIIASDAPDDHPCAPKGEPPDDCHVWNDEDCKWESLCEEGEVCCGGSCVKVDSCNPCCGDDTIDVCTELGGGGSLSADGFNKIASVLAKAPMISDAKVTLDVKGEIEVKRCCKDGESKLVYSGAGDFSAGLTVGLNMPGLKGKIEDSWEGVYYVFGEYFIGPIATVSAEGGGSVSYEKNECEDTFCNKGVGSASVGMDVKYGGKVELLVETYRDTPVTHIVGELTAGGSTSVNASTSWSSGTCEPGPASKVCWGALTASGQLTGGLFGVGEFSFSVSREILSGGCL